MKKSKISSCCLRLNAQAVHCADKDTAPHGKIPEAEHAQTAEQMIFIRYSGSPKSTQCVFFSVKHFSTTNMAFILYKLSDKQRKVLHLELLNATTWLHNLAQH